VFDTLASITINVINRYQQDNMVNKTSFLFTFSTLKITLISKEYLIFSNIMNYIVFMLSFSLLILSGNSFADSTTSKSTYDWTGVYVGGFVGGASSAKTTASQPYTTHSPAHYWNTPYGNTM
jgi:hypothetical protein